METPILVHIHIIAIRILLVLVGMPVAIGTTFATMYNMHRALKARFGQFRSKERLYLECKWLVRFMLIPYSRDAGFAGLKLLLLATALKRSGAHNSSMWKVQHDNGVLQKRALRHPGYRKQAFLNDLVEMNNERARLTADNQQMLHTPYLRSSRVNRFKRALPDKPPIQLRWQYRVMKWAFMPIYFLFRILWKLLSWCWLQTSTVKTVHSDRHRWDWHRWFATPSVPLTAGQDFDEIGRFKHMAHLLRASRGGRAFSANHSRLNLLKVLLELPNGNTKSNNQRKGTKLSCGKSRQAKKSRRCAHFPPHATSMMSRNTFWHIPPQDLIEQLLKAR